MVSDTLLSDESAIEEEEIVEELEADEPPAHAPSEADIARKYEEGQARILIQRNDFLVPNILQMVESAAILDISPPYQRRARWTLKKRSQLIESLLMNVPIPPIFLYERDYARYEVMDGQQRLTSIRAFFKNEFQLSGLTFWHELNGRSFRDLPNRIQAGLERRSLAAVIILTESGARPAIAMQIRQYVFERLNTGGQPLNAQEVRNCIYASAFNDLLIALARSDLFTKVWDIPPKEPDEPHRISSKLERNTLYASMYDCEIVLRYFALSDPQNLRGGMKRTLDTFMSKMMKASPENLADLEREYLDVLQIAHAIYQQALFRLPGAEGMLSGRRSVPFSDALLLGIRAHRAYREQLIGNRAHIVEETRQLLRDPQLYEALVGRANTRDAINERIGIMTKMIGRHVSA